MTRDSLRYEPRRQGLVPSNAGQAPRVAVVSHHLRTNLLLRATLTYSVTNRGGPVASEPATQTSGRNLHSVHDPVGFQIRGFLLGILCLAVFLAVGCSGNEAAQEETRTQEGAGAEAESSAQPNIVYPHRRPGLRLRFPVSHLALPVD